MTDGLKRKIEYGFGLVLFLSACGGEPGKNSRDINPVLYMHRYDSTSFAVRVNQVQRVAIGHAPLTKREFRDDYYPVWVFIPDTVGTFTGREIGKAFSSTSPDRIHRTDAFPSQRIEIGGGSIHFRGMVNMEAEGRFKVEMRSSDPCARGCQSHDVILPVPP